MNKPTSLIVQECKQDLVNTLNNSGLPAFILEPIIKDIYQQIAQAMVQEYNRDKQEYLMQDKNNKKSEEA